MNKLYKELTMIRAQAAVAGATAAAKISHPALQGQLCEIVIRDLLRPLLPADIGLGTGKVISAYENGLSKQQDVILFNRSILPPVIFEETTGLFPIESVLFTVEIKATLRADDVRSSISSASQLLSLKMLSGQYDANDNFIQSFDLIRPRSTLLAFDSDLVANGKSEIDRFKEIWGHSIGEPPIHAICVVGRGCWYWKNSEWNTFPRPHELAEVLAFVSWILNSYKPISDSRKAPRIGEYLIE
jgi:hypothetical protein